MRDILLFMLIFALCQSLFVVLGHGFVWEHILLFPYVFTGLSLFGSAVMGVLVVSNRHEL